MNARFQGLRELLEQQTAPVVRLSFEQLETLLGRPLPDSDDRGQDGWWNYRDISRGAAGASDWQSKVDYRRREVVFTRV